MDASKLRAWWAHRQGLDGRLQGKSTAQILEETGWARSVGGVNPYLTLFTRGNASREQIEEDVENLEIHELPSVRGCTYVLPKADFALGLKLSQGFGDASDLAIAKKYLGVTDEEIDHLSDKVLDTLNEGPMDPKTIRDNVGAIVRNLGEAGKKRGLTTTLPIVLGRLQSLGEIRRVPINGRLDQQRYSYTRWTPNPLSQNQMSDEEAYLELGKRYFKWIGPATQVNFQWFVGLGVKATKNIVEQLGLVPLEANSPLLMFPEDREALSTFRSPRNPQYKLVASIDAVTMLRRDVVSLLDTSDLERKMQGEKKVHDIGSVMDLASHAIMDRGRIVGLWEYDPNSGKIAWKSFIPADDAMRKEIARTEAYVREELGDARSFSLDSPESRVPRIIALRTPDLAEHQ